MSGDELIADLQRLAAEFDYYDEKEPDRTGAILDRLRAAHPKATAEQVLIAVRRAEFELERMISDVEGWWSYLVYDVEDPRWQKLERMKGHALFLDHAELCIEATVYDETVYMLAELHDEMGDRMLVLRPGHRLADEIALPPLVMIVERHDAGPEVFDQPSLDRLLGIAKIFCVRCMKRDDRSHAKGVRNAAMGMAAGTSPDLYAVQHHRPGGPAVLLVICRDRRKYRQVTADAWSEAWTEAWEERGIFI